MMWRSGFSFQLLQKQSEKANFLTWIQFLRFPYYTTIITYSIYRLSYKDNWKHISVIKTCLRLHHKLAVASSFFLSDPHVDR